MGLFYLSRAVNTKLINHVLTKYFSKSACVFGTGEKIIKSLFIPLQKEKPKNHRKISVIGAAGIAGRTIIHDIIRNRYLCDEVVMYDRAKQKIVLCGEILDFVHAGSLFGIPHLTLALDEPEYTKDSDVIILTCGVPRKKGQSRLDLAQTNIDILKKIVPCLAELSPDCVFIVVSNPADILAYATWKYSCFPKNRIIGAGTLIDSSRFSYYISQRLKINPFSIKANIIAEHGDSSVPVWSMANVAGTRLRDLDPTIASCGDKNNWKEVYKYTRDAGDCLIKSKGHTNWCIGMSVGKITEAVLQNNKTVHTVSVCAKGICSIESDCFLSFPAVLGNRGVFEVVQQCYDEKEVCGIEDSVEKMEEVLKCVNF